MIQTELLYPWYALQVRPRYENLVAQVLMNKGYEPFLPAFSSRHRWSDRLVEVQQAMFPGYLFCRLDLGSRLLPMYTTPGFLRIVGLGRSPCPVADGEIDGIRRIMESGLEAHPWPVPKVGEWVRLESGPLKGLEGTLVSVKKRHRLVVSVTLLQRAVAVEVEEDVVRPAGRIGLAVPPPQPQSVLRTV